MKFQYKEDSCCSEVKLSWEPAIAAYKKAVNAGKKTYDEVVQELKNAVNEL